MPLLPGPAQGLSHAASPARSAVRPAQLPFSHPPSTAPFRPLGAVAPPSSARGAPRNLRTPPALFFRRKRSARCHGWVPPAPSSRCFDPCGARCSAPTPRTGSAATCRAVPRRALPSGPRPRLPQGTPRGSCRSPAVSPPRAYRVPVAHVRLMLLLHPYRGGSLSCPCRVRVTSLSLPAGGGTDGPTPVGLPEQTAARGPGLAVRVTPRTRAGPGGAVPELSAALP